MVSPKLCVKCKGKLLCGLKSCPILEKFKTIVKVTSRISGNSFSGSSPPSFFVSWSNYPKVSIAPMTPTIVGGSTSDFDNPEKWFNFPTEKVLLLREQLIRSNKKVFVSDASNPSYELVEMQELVMSKQPVEVEVSLLKKPKPILSFSDSVAPIGPSAPLKSLNLVENPVIPKKVDYFFSDIDAKASVALSELFKSKLPVHFLYKLLSAGTLGVKKQRKFVPTRWAITAVDSTLSEQLIERVKSFQELSTVQIFHSKKFDNSFFVLLVPGSWAFEQLECWIPGSVWTESSKQPHIITDFEFFKGRKDYPSNVEGAYFASRLAVAEFLVEKKRQASAIVFREIGRNYQIPLGVWVVRENIRKAMKSAPLSFSDLSLALKFLEQKLKVPLNLYKKESKLLDFLQKQKKLSDF